MAQTVAIPGQLLGPSTKYLAGPGTHIHESNLYSSLLGTVTLTQPEKAPGPAKRMTKIIPQGPATLPTISVSRSGSGSGSGSNLSAKREVLPEVGNVVLCRVTRINPRQATVAILVVGESVLEGEWQGLIRSQDVRATEKDRVKIYESFRPGDIVRAHVVGNWSSVAEKELRVADVHPNIRYPSATRPTTTSQPRATSLASSWPRARPATPCTPSAGRSTRTPRPAYPRAARSRSLSEPTHCYRLTTL